MRRVERAQVRAPIASTAHHIVTTTFSAPGTLIFDDGYGEPASCIRCPDTPCMIITDETNATQLETCAFNAIELVEQVPTITDRCTGCGLCVLRCPVGAISLSPVSGIADVQAPRLGRYFFEASAREHQQYRDSVTLDWQVGEIERQALSIQLAEITQVLGHDKFYPFVASIFTDAGFAAVVGNPGDTSNRIDIVLIHPDDSLPVEVKSPTESSYINVKSIQQALENKVVMDERQFYPTLLTSSSLVVGLEYPPARSGVQELVDDIYTVYGVRIGLIALPRLLTLLLTARLDGEVHERGVLGRLHGPL